MYNNNDGDDLFFSFIQHKDEDNIVGNDYLFDDSAYIPIYDLKSRIETLNDASIVKEIVRNRKMDNWKTPKPEQNSIVRLFTSGALSDIEGKTLTDFYVFVFKKYPNIAEVFNVAQTFAQCKEDNNYGTLAQAVIKNNRYNNEFETLLSNPFNEFIKDVYREKHINVPELVADAALITNFGALALKDSEAFSAQANAGHDDFHQYNYEFKYDASLNFDVSKGCFMITVNYTDIRQVDKQQYIEDDFYTCQQVGTIPGQMQTVFEVRDGESELVSWTCSTATIAELVNSRFFFTNTKLHPNYEQYEKFLAAIDELKTIAKDKAFETVIFDLIEKVREAQEASPEDTSKLTEVCKETVNLINAPGENSQHKAYCKFADEKIGTKTPAMAAVKSAMYAVAATILFAVSAIVTVASVLTGFITGWSVVGIGVGVFGTAAGGAGAGVSGYLVGKAERNYTFWKQSNDTTKKMTAVGKQQHDVSSRIKQVHSASSALAY